MRLLPTLVAVLTALTLAACGGRSDPVADAPDSGALSSGPAAALAAAPDASLAAPSPDAATLLPPVTPEKSMLIVTTQATVSGSRLLGKYADAKRARGMSVTVATEADYGGPGEKGRTRALRIRAWLRGQYQRFGYLLLVGDPGTEYGDVPMLKVWPRDDLANSCGGIDCETSGTDSFYANPNGEWDLNGNGRYAEWGVDDQAGGVDLFPYLTVGRFPVYFGDTDELDRLLEHVLAYMNADPGALAYRKKLLFAKSFVFFKGEIFFPNTPPIEASVDTAETSEWFIKNYLPPERGASYTRLYEREGVVVSKYPSDQALTEDGFVEEWRKGYGMIWWGGHGAPTGVARTVWTADPNQNGAADGDEIKSSRLIVTEDSERLDGAPAGFVVATSCYVGRIEVPDALSYSLIRHGAAVGVIASSAPASVDESAFEKMGPQLDRSHFDIDRVGVMVFDGLLRGESAGRLVAKARLELAPDNDIDAFQAKMMINFYGDPSLTLYDSAADVRY